MIESDTTTTNIATIFRATRKLHRLQQTEIAAILEVTQGTISKVESGNMHPELGLWFKLLKSFSISDPYCFTYGGLEFNENTFSNLEKEGSPFLPLYRFTGENTLFSARTLRPIFEYLLKTHFKALETFLKEKKVALELFYVLNHPIPVEFAEAFFIFLHDNKINDKSLSHLNLSFASAYGAFSNNVLKTNSLEVFFDILNKEKDAIAKYKYDNNSQTYTVTLNKKSQNKMNQIQQKDSIINYNLLFPYYYLKSTKQSKMINPKIVEVKKNVEWKIAYAS